MSLSCDLGGLEGARGRGGEVGCWLRVEGVVDGWIRWMKFDGGFLCGLYLAVHSVYSVRSALDPTYSQNENEKEKENRNSPYYSISHLFTFPQNPSLINSIPTYYISFADIHKYLTEVSP